jgi:putative glycerol-1-phosphate prenyltransferase
MDQPKELFSRRKFIKTCLAAGGGLRSREEIRDAFLAGANLVILGNGCEKNPTLIAEACSERDEIRKNGLSE